MNNIFRYIYRVSIGVFVILCSQFLNAQEEDNLGTEVVNVVKPYTPTIRDAFKVKATPQINDSITTAKKIVTYSIFSAPVASTFTPAKGKAATVKKAKRVKLYDNYATLGFGSFTSVLAEFYSNFQISRTEDFGVFLNHNSSQGGIDNALTKDFFYDSRLNLNYGARERDLNWRTDLDLKHQVFNWYGTPRDANGDVLQEDGFAIINNDTDVAHTYFTAGLNGSLELKDSFFQEGKLQLRYFGDSEESNEIRAVLTPTLEFPVSGELIKTKLTVDYVSGTQGNNISDTAEGLNYGFLKGAIHPSFVFLRDDLTINIGAEPTVLLNTEESETDFFIYPKINASYRVVGDYFIAYAGLEGGLEQNNYHDFAQENPFVSPDLIIAPTDRQYDGFLGMKGKLAEAVSYNLRASYTAQNNNAFYLHNPYSPSGEGFGDAGWDYGNSFGIVYDDLKTISVFAELNFDVNSNFKMKINAEYFNYTTENIAEAWNLPDLQASIFADYQISEQWFAGVNLFFVGERRDLDFSTSPLDVLIQPTTVTLDSYFDANAHVGYRVSDRLSAFAKVNNFLNSDYQKWLFYEVQGLQAMLGATYKFDF